jgi:hypothetical protein
MQGQTIEGQVIDHSPSLVVENGSLFVQVSGLQRELFKVNENQITPETVFQLVDKLDSAPEAVKAQLLNSALEQSDSWGGKETGLLRERLVAGGYSDDGVARVVNTAMERTQLQAENKRNLIARRPSQPENDLNEYQEGGVMSRFMGLIGRINQKKC